MHALELRHEQSYLRVSCYNASSTNHPTLIQKQSHVAKFSSNAKKH
jgi:hypothetical protein